MTGWRVGFAIGGAPLIAALGQVKANTDSGIFTAIQFAAKTALDEYDTLTPPIRALYKERRDAFVGALKGIGWDVPTPRGHLLRLDPLPQGLHLDRAVRPDPRRGRRRHHPRPRLRPDRRRLHPGRPDRRHPPAPPGRRADRQAEPVTVTSRPMNTTRPGSAWAATSATAGRSSTVPSTPWPGPGRGRPLRQFLPRDGARRRPARPGAVPERRGPTWRRPGDPRTRLLDRLARPRGPSRPGPDGSAGASGPSTWTS